MNKMDTINNNTSSVTLALLNNERKAKYNMLSHDAKEVLEVGVLSILENMALPCKEYIKYRNSKKVNLKTCIYVLIHNPDRKDLELYFKNINNKNSKQNKIILKENNIKYSDIPTIIEPITNCVDSIIVYRSATGYITEIAAREFHGTIFDFFIKKDVAKTPAQSGGKTLKAKKLSSKRNTLKSKANASHRKI